MLQQEHEECPSPLLFNVSTCELIYIYIFYHISLHLWYRNTEPTQHSRIALKPLLFLSCIELACLYLKRGSRLGRSGEMKHRFVAAIECIFGRNRLDSRHPPELLRVRFGTDSWAFINRRTLQIGTGETHIIHHPISVSSHQSHLPSQRPVVQKHDPSLPSAQPPSPAEGRFGSINRTLWNLRCDRTHCIGTGARQLCSKSKCYK